MLIEQTILDYLTSNGVAAYLEIPEGGLTPPCCVIERTGGGETDHIREATVVIQSYGATLYLAAQLNELVRELMEDIIALPSIAACELNSDYNFTDTTKKLYRYQAVYSLVYYG